MFTVHPIDGNDFLVKDGDKDDLVNLIETTCSYREFQIDLLSCKHAFAALSACKKLFIDFAQITIRNSVWLKHILHLLDQSGHKNKWIVPKEISSIVVKAPLCLSQAGRPKKTRIPSTREYCGKKSRTCSWCKQAGHNRQNCPTPLGFTTTNTTETQLTQTRKQCKCGGCGGQGHNKRTCPHG
ncbi:hypothetical protein Ddye_009002 [Dipteronia dyeriana]|uniref:CCHC-type domain-containing protein n=1 Tax=Dipteronia dyeriana TaxID=168575 RepID=A0AAD9XAK8_9ROSI|nr:hypothetical protein Ddye_009002 [Dipteronia dyeriana]